MANRINRSFSSDHPASIGHFPGNPIIPGAVLLNEILDTISSTEHASPVSFEISSAKFLRPVRPGDTVVVTWEVRANGEIRFECMVMPDDRTALMGVLKATGGAT
jgi:3-hydroxymyristoyl/3-hydroxydecanoyl-(acyl carrier protein) dehydratase